MLRLNRRRVVFSNSNNWKKNAIFERSLQITITIKSCQRTRQRDKRIFKGVKFTRFLSYFPIWSFIWNIVFLKNIEGHKSCIGHSMWPSHRFHFAVAFYKLPLPPQSILNIFTTEFIHYEFFVGIFFSVIQSIQDRHFTFSPHG